MKSVVARNQGCASVLGWILLALGTFFLGALLWNQVRVAVFGEVTDGFVEKVTTRVSYGSAPRRPGESLESNRDRSGGGVAHDLHIRFPTSGGKEVGFTTVSTFGHELAEGDAVRVIYLPHQPEKAEIYSPKQLWLPTLTGTIVTAIFLGGGIYLRRTMSSIRRAG